MPAKPEREPLLVRLPPGVREEAKLHAQRLGMSLNEYVTNVLTLANASEERAMSDAQIPPELSGFVDEPGVIMKDFPDALNEHVKLQGIRDFELYDTSFQINPYQWPKGVCERLLAEPPDVSLFTGPSGRPSALTNLTTSGMLTWPKKMDVVGLGIQFDRPLDPKLVRELSVQFQIGEKVVRQAALAGMKEEAQGLTRRYRLDWEHSDLIPSVQHFSITLCLHGHWIGETEVRGSLRGTLWREIQ